MTILELFGNNLSSIPSLSGCTSLTTLSIYNNFLASLPSLPTSLVTLNAGDLNDPSVRRNNFGAMSYVFTALTGLTTVNFNCCGITSWSSQLPNSIRTVNISNASGTPGAGANNLTTFNCALVTNQCLILNLNYNLNLSTITNLNSCTNLQTFSAMRSALATPSSFGTFPNGIRSITLDYTILTFSDSTFLNNLTYNGINISMKGCGLTQTSIQFLINALVNSNILNGTLNLTNILNPAPLIPNNNTSLNNYSGYSTLISRGWSFTPPL
jgi:hypothetical protein